MNGESQNAGTWSRMLYHESEGFFQQLERLLSIGKFLSK